MKLSTYLNFNGDCAEAFKFYQQCLGGEITAMFSFGEAPGCEDFGSASRNMIMHACLAVDGQMLMGSDAPRSARSPTRASRAPPSPSMSTRWKKPSACSRP